MPPLVMLPFMFMFATLYDRLRDEPLFARCPLAALRGWQGAGDSGTWGCPGDALLLLPGDMCSPVELFGDGVDGCEYCDWNRDMSAMDSARLSCEDPVPWSAFREMTPTLPPPWPITV